MGEFVHLHLHSEYSLLDGACRVADIPKKAKAEGHTAVAVTDHGNLYAAVAFYDACRAEGIKPIIGCEVYVAARTRFDKEGKRDSSGNHLILLVKNAEGWHNLAKMVSASYVEGFYSKPRVDRDLLRQYSGGLIALSGCLAGYIPQMIISGNLEAAREEIRFMQDTFGKDDFYLEMQNHGLAEEQAVLSGLYDLHIETGAPLAATNDAHYIEKSDAYNQAILLCVQTASVISDGRPIGFETDEFYYKSTSEMKTLFGRYEGAIENTVNIAQRCNFDFDFGKVYLPTFVCESGTPLENLTAAAMDGLDSMARSGVIDFSHGTRRQYEERVKYELSVIDGKGYTEYYLIVADYVGFAKKSGIRVGPGRGSGAGSLVAYLIGITEVDPLRYDLLFERFLNPERKSMPDFDVDFEDDRKDEVVKYVARRYGEDHVAQIVTFNTLAAKAALRDVGRALGMPYADVDGIVKLLPKGLNITLADAMSTKAVKEKYDSSPEAKRLIDIASAIEGMPRNSSTHAAGVVISEKPVSDYVPLSRNGDTIVTQFDMDTIARLGLVKFDFLALRYLRTIDRAVAMINTAEPGFDIEKIPMDDKETFAMIASGQTNGVFQLESSGMKQVLTQLRPESIDDIIAAVALYRPGPMDSIPKYIACRHGRMKVEYPHSDLSEILSSTYGCIVYQEQVMEIFRRIAGYSYGQADIVRRAMAKKKADVMEAERPRFVSGAAAKGIDGKEANKLFDDMASFASYAFNKCHAAPYGVLAYRTAYMKTHYRRFFMAALLSSELGNFAKTAEYTGECKKYGIMVLPPDVRESREDFTVSGGNIRFGLLAVRNVGSQFIKDIITEREEKPFSGFEDFISRMYPHNLNKRQVESLIKCGACDGFGVYRSRMMASYELLIDRTAEQSRANIEGQIDIFSAGGSGVVSAAGFAFPEIPEFSTREKLMLEKECSGMYFSGHMLDDYLPVLEKLPHTPLSAFSHGDGDENAESDGEEETAQIPDGSIVQVVGIITKITKKNTRSGQPMAFLTLEDRYGEAEMIVFPKVLERFSYLIAQENAVSITGEISSREDEGQKLLVTDIKKLENAAAVKATETQSGAERGNREDENAPAGARLCINADSESSVKVERALAAISLFPGSCEVHFYFEDTKKRSRLRTAGVRTNKELMGLLREIFGRENVVLR